MVALSGIMTLNGLIIPLSVLTDPAVTLGWFVCLITISAVFEIKHVAYCVHTPSEEELKIVHPANFPCGQAWIMYGNALK